MESHRNKEPAKVDNDIENYVPDIRDSTLGI
jgi:hypothetical protein